MKKFFGFCCFLLLATRWGLAQNNEVNFSAGAMFTFDQNATTTFTPLVPCTIPNCNVIADVVKASTAFSFEASYARRLAGVGPVDLYLELPMVGTPGHSVDGVIRVTSINPLNATTSSSLFFFTPSARVKFFSSARISPWVTAGGGWAGLTQGSQTANKGAVQFGGGLDFKTGVPHLAVRGEVRDFWAGGVLQSGVVAAPLAPVTATITISPEHLHHVFAGGGVVLRF